jgi:hypothetical protein
MTKESANDTIIECQWCEGSGLEFNEQNQCRVCTECNGTGFCTGPTSALVQNVQNVQPPVD